MQHAQSIAWVALILCLALVPLARSATEHTVPDGWLPTSAEAVQVQRIQAEEFGGGQTTYYLLFTSDQGLTADDPAFVRSVQQVIRPLHILPEVERVVAWGTTGSDLLNEILIADDRMSSIAIVTLKDTPVGSVGSPDWIRANLGESDLTVHMTGLPVVGEDFRVLGHNDLVRAELIALPLTLVLLLLIFRNWIAALLSVVTAAGSLVITLAVMAVLARSATVNVFTVNAVTMLGLAVGIDYALIMVSRFREEIGRSAPDEALATTLQHAGRTVVVAGSTVAIGLSGLVFFDVPAATTTAALGAVVVLAAMAMALVVLPAILILAVAALTAKPENRRAWTGLHALEALRERHPLLTIAICTLVLTTMTLPALSMRAVSPGIDNLPSAAESRQTAEQILQQFPLASTAPIDITMQPNHGSMLEPDNLAVYRALVTRIEAMPGVERVEALWTYLPSALTADSLAGAFILQPELVTASAPYLTPGAARLAVIPQAGLGREDQEHLVQDIRASLAGDATLDATILVGGSVGLDLNLLDYVEGRIPTVVLWVYVFTAVALFVHLRSLMLPIKALVMNTLSMGAAFGALVWIFQDGHIAWLSRNEADGTTVMLVPILMFCFLFGLGMDFEIIMLSRIREAWLQSGDTTVAVAEGLERAAGIVTASAALMLAVFLSFGFGQLGVVRALGFGLAIAVVLDATVIRLLLMPATMQVLGNWNWWPARRN